ncbi:hypothetical protein M3182_17675 [Mesobacillus maritimus]|uniref:hypothetical protein n=1 Tax=Mesobacillus maritimus TaxID=1643336 RepID=UPI00203B8424|nr:hypothetical protein [Mesobacillus maritimus]MCM3587569.1 hypothetical protein [Mesobacillus maritimus]MCM3671992.1 hypothetical protein [Mesobacillus maritimus]
MKIYKLRNHFRGINKGTHFYLIAESEYIGIKDFVLRTKDLSLRVSVSEGELEQHFTLVTNKGESPFN